MLPVRFILTGGQAADITQAIPLMQGIRTSALLADKGYDADVLLAWLNARDIAAVIPPKANRREQRICDWHQYKERHVIECMFGKLKHFRRIATRFEKKASHFKEILAFAAVLVMAPVMLTEPSIYRKTHRELQGKFKNKIP